MRQNRGNTVFPRFFLQLFIGLVICTICTSQGRGSVRGEPLRVPPLAFNRPPAGDHFCAAKVQLHQNKSHPSGGFCFGGAEGSRTPVRKHFDRTFSGRSQVSAFPPCAGTWQTAQFSRVMMRGRGNSYPPHGRHLNDAFPGRWPLRFRRSLLKQRRQQY